ncbi:hypothetical protein ACT9XH_01880 [Methanococcoides methylutens]|uniref:hypothetical protein n=1 Tax=Methanococcoides methylutens TaxID=2226 RepID=UPI004044D971
MIEIELKYNGMVIYMKNNYKIYDFVPGVATVESNVDRIPMFYYAGQLNDNVELDKVTPNIKVKYSVVDNINSVAGLNINEFKNRSSRFTNMYYLNNVIYYERNIGLGLKIKLCFIDDEQKPELIVNKTYHKFVKSNVDTVYATGRRLAHIVHTKLLEKEIATIHAAATSYNNQAILLMAPSNTGKTSTVLNSILRNYKFVSEDICVTDGENIYGCPLNYGFQTIHQSSSPQKININNKLKYKLFDFFPMLAYYLNKPMDLTVDKFKINMEHKDNNLTTFSSTKLGYIFILSSSPDKKYTELNATEAFDKIYTLQRNEFLYLSDYLISTYYFLNSNAHSIKSISQMEESIIQKMISKSHVYEIFSNDPKDYIKVIDEIVKNH